MAFGTVAAAALLLRIPSIAEPLGIDQSLWASAVRGMVDGDHLYRDVWEQRPPGIYLTYLIAFSLGGWTTSVVAWLDVLASAVTAVLLYLVARWLAGRTAGALAAALYSTLTMPAWLYRYSGFLERSVCETFIVICAGLAALCAVGLRQRPTATLAFGIGFWTGAAIIFKPNAAVYGPAFLIWGLTGRAGEGPRARVRLLVAAALGVTVVPLLTVAWLWSLDLLAEARTAVIDFNRWYVAIGFSPGAYVEAFSRSVFLRMKTEPLWLGGSLASIAALWGFARTRRLAPLPGLAIAWGAAAALAIAVNGMWLFNTYFIHALAPLTLMTTWWLTSAASGGAVRRAAVWGTAVLMVLLLVQRNYVPKVIDSAVADTKALLGRLEQRPYLERFGGYGNQRGYSAVANAELAEYVRAHTRSEERIFLFGINGAGVYFLADRQSAHRFLRVNFFVPDGFPDPAFTLGAVVAELRERRPAYLIFEQLHSESAMARAVDALQEDPLIRSLLAEYVYEARIEDFTLYRRSEAPGSGRPEG